MSCEHEAFDSKLDRAINIFHVDILHTRQMIFLNMMLNIKVILEEVYYLNSDKDTFFSLIKLWKVLAVMFIPTFMTYALTSDFLWSISPGWVVMFLDSNRTVFTFSSW